MRVPHDTKKSILILERDSDLAESIRLYLEDSFNVYICENPANIISKINQINVDILLSGIDFPLSVLRDLFKEVRQARPLIKILVMYMFFDTDKWTETLILNDADDYISKPFDVDILKNKLDRLIKLSEKMPPKKKILQ